LQARDLSAIFKRTLELLAHLIKVFLPRVAPQDVHPAPFMSDGWLVEHGLYRDHLAPFALLPRALDPRVLGWSIRSSVFTKPRA
jgi:hypothetical protein